MIFFNASINVSIFFLIQCHSLGQYVTKFFTVSISFSLSHWVGIVVIIYIWQAVFMFHSPVEAVQRHSALLRVYFSFAYLE